LISFNNYLISTQNFLLVSKTTELIFEYVSTSRVLTHFKN